MTAVTALRTPDDRFAGLPDFPYPPRYADDLPGYDLPGDDAVADVAAGPEGKALSGTEVVAGLVVGDHDRHDGVVSGMQRLLAVPADLRRQVPD